MTERNRQNRGKRLPELRRGGRGDIRRVGREGPGSLTYWRDQAPISERVVQAHLQHFCPGGLGLPVTGSLPVGFGPTNRAPGAWEGNSARAAGQLCGRCRRPITPVQDARRRASGLWVHEACPT
jgi:hypothetical protein